MLEQQAGIQAKTASNPQKSSNVGPYDDGDTSNRVRVFSTVDFTPGDTCHRKAGQKGPHLITLRNPICVVARSVAWALSRPICHFFAKDSVEISG
jgi:hypothetical protein